MVRSLALCDLPGRMGRTAEPWRRYGIAKIIGQGRGPGGRANGRHRAPGGKGPTASEHRPGRERGVFGALTFFVGNEMFWGNDRFDFVEEALRKLV
jgi:hypothetical protein